MVSRWYQDGEYSRFTAKPSIRTLAIMKINCLHIEAQLLGYKCHLRYIFNYTL